MKSNGKIDQNHYYGISSSSQVMEYAKFLPSGYKFVPSKKELINDYLIPKIDGKPVPLLIHEVNIYDYSPDELTAEYIPQGEKEWYFFTPRDKKYLKGKRPNRAARCGYWKATGADEAVEQCGTIIGYKKTLVFYKGRSPHGDKTEWIMYEYRGKGPSVVKKREGVDLSMRLDDVVLCSMHKKPPEKNKSRPKGESNQIEIEPETELEPEPEPETKPEPEPEPESETSTPESNALPNNVIPMYHSNNYNYANNYPIRNNYLAKQLINHSQYEPHTENIAFPYDINGYTSLEGSLNIQNEPIGYFPDLHSQFYNHGYDCL